MTLLLFVYVCIPQQYKYFIIRLQFSKFITYIKRTLNADIEKYDKRTFFIEMLKILRMPITLEDSAVLISISTFPSQ